jgi:predicted permease
VLDDLRVAVRSLWRSPAFSLTTVLTLALAAGASAAIFAVVHAVLLKPLPYAEPDRLVAVWPGRLQSNADLVLIRERGAMFSQVAAVAPGWTMSLTGDGEPTRLTVARVSGNFFETLGAPAAFGRTLRPEDDRKGAEATIVLGHELWMRRFGGDPTVVGRIVRIDGEPLRVAGVMPRAFEVFGLKADAYTPFTLDESAWYHQITTALLVGRLAPGRTLDQADRDYQALIPGIRTTRGYTAEYGRTARLEDLRTATVGDARTPLTILGAAVALILLIAAANIATLQLTRATARGRDLAVRRALGASGARLARQVLAESALLAAAGGALGVVCAQLALPALVAMLPADLPRAREIAVDATVVAAVLLSAVVVGLAVGLAPALASARLRVAPMLREGASSESRRRRRARGTLVSAEIALAVLLTIGAGLMLRTLASLQRIDPGFRPDGVLTLHLQPSGDGPARRSVADYYADVLDRVRALPGVQSAGAIQHLPFSGYSWNASLDISGFEPAPGASRPVAGLRIATPGYFEAIGQPVIAGRGFERADATRPEIVIVNRSLAAKYFGSATAAMGRTLRIRGGRLQSPWMTIVGVAGDVRHTSLTDVTGPEIYTSVGRSTIPAMMIAIRTGGDASGLVAPVREAIWSVDRDVPLSDIRPMPSRIDVSLGRPRLLLTLLGSFAVLGLTLAAIGIYGVIAYSAAQRRRELAIRVALGAQRGRIVRSVLSEALVYAVTGLALGLPAALLASRAMRTIVWGVSATDPLTYVGMAAGTLVIVTTASLWPALRASRADPVAALKS